MRGPINTHVHTVWLCSDPGSFGRRENFPHIDESKPLDKTLLLGQDFHALKIVVSEMLHKQLASIGNYMPIRLMLLSPQMQQYNTISGLNSYMVAIRIMTAKAGTFIYRPWDYLLRPG